MKTEGREGLSAGEWAVFGIVSLVNLVPLWAFRYFPGQDTANHLYGVEVLRGLLDRSAGPAIATTFAPTFGLKSNVLFQALMLGLSGLGISVELGHRLILSAYALAFPLAGIACARAANPRNTVLALLLLPLAWNWFALQGLYNYVLSLVPALVWLGIVARDGGRPSRPAAVAVMVAALAVYFAHVGTFLALLFVTALRIIWPDDGMRLALRVRLAPVAPLALALSPAVVLAAARFGGELANRTPPEATLSVFEAYGPLEAAGSFFVEFAMRFHVWELAVLGPPLVALIVIPLAAPRGRPPGGAPRWPLGAALFLSIVYFLAPHIVFGSDASPRLRPLIVFCLLCYAGVTLSRRGRRRVAALALASGVLGAAALSIEFAGLNRDLDDFASGIPSVQEGSRLYPLVFDPRGPSGLVKPFLHAWGYYGLARHVVTPFAFAWHDTRFPYRYRDLPLHDRTSRLPSDGEDEPNALVQGRLCPSVRRFATSLSCADVRRDAEERWATLGTAYDYLLIWAAPADLTTLLAARGYRLLHAQGRLTLYAPPVMKLR